MTTQNNKRILHRKEFQMMTPAPTASVAGAFILKDPAGLRKTAMLITSAVLQYLYHIDEDGWQQIPSMALAGTFGAGACGSWGVWSNTVTANGGTTTTITTTANISSLAVGRKVRFLTGANAGNEATVLRVSVIPGGTSTIVLSAPLGVAVANADTFKIDTGVYYLMNAGTIATGIFKSYDVLTGTVTSLANAGLPATWGTDGKMVATPSYIGSFATGTATAGAGSTLTNLAKTWATNQWTNYQIRITGGTGKGQIRTIASNTGTVITVSSAWTVNPDATSTYEIEGNDDYLYLLGNNAVTMYRYSISANTWTTMSPTVARAGAPIAGMSANWIGKTKNATWEDESNILDGRYIYSFRGGSATLDRFDIAGGTAGAGAWANVAYIRAQETFATGSSYDHNNGKIYIKKDATGRFFYLDIPGNILLPFNTDMYPDGVALLGDKMFTATYSTGSGDDIDWLYFLNNTATVFRRIMIF